MLVIIVAFTLATVNIRATKGPLRVDIGVPFLV